MMSHNRAHVSAWFLNMHAFSKTKIDLWTPPVEANHPIAHNEVSNPDLALNLTRNKKYRY